VKSVDTKLPIIVGISGASGVVYGIKMLGILKQIGIPVHLVMSKSAEITFAYETKFKLAEIHSLASVVHRESDIAASISSGSFETLGMIVAPCSIKSMSEIAYGISGNLLSRAADVTLKERRRLVLMLRETPLHTGHLKTMLTLSEIGAIIAPPVPAFYNLPKTIDDIVNHSIGRVLDLFGIKMGGIKRWKDTSVQETRITYKCYK
jgi:4-hydroxy-3-polyprenylbenzoate decarboxylase